MAAAAAAETQPEGIPAPGLAESGNADQTDPGVGPPAPVRSLPPQVVGVVVPSPVVAGPAVAAALADAIAESPGSPSVPPPSSVPPGAKQDSVELLLSGISGPRPARSRTTPQTGGEASAVYHAEHDVHAGQPAPEPPKNTRFERPLTPRAIPIAAAAARKAAQGKSVRAEPTVVTERALARRLVVALAGALVIVAALFTVSQVAKLRTAESHSMAAPAPPPPAAVAVPPPTTAGSQVPAAVDSAPAKPDPSGSPAQSGSAEPAPPEPSASSAPAPSGESAASHPPVRPLMVPSLVHRRHRVGLGVVSTAPAPSSGDVGEFKTTF